VRRRLRDALLVVLVGLAVTACLPEGALDEVRARQGQAVQVRGWARDPETTAPVDVHVYVDGRIATAVRADRPRPDVQAAYADAGPNHGYDVAIPLSPGLRRVCTYAIDAGTGSVNPQLGCRWVVVPGTGALPVTVIGSSVQVQNVPEVQAELTARGYRPTVVARNGVTIDHSWTRARLTEAATAPIVVVDTGNNDTYANAQVADVAGLQAALDGFRWKLVASRMLAPGGCVVWMNARDATNPIYRPEYAPATNQVLAGAFAGDVVVDWAGISRPHGLAWFVADLLHLDELRDPLTGAVVLAGPRRQAGADARARALADGVDACAARYR
jgi:hypothetical protein